MSNWWQNLDQIKAFADQAKYALDDEHEGNFKDAVYALETLASELAAAVRSM